MTCSIITRVLGAGLIATLLALPGIASADVAEKVATAFRGQLLFSERELPPSAGSADRTIAQFKKESARPIAREEKQSSWTLFFLAFPEKQSPSREITIDFYAGNEKSPVFVTYKRLTMDPSARILRGSFDVSEDDGLKPGNYTVKLTAKRNDKEVTLASSEIELK